MSARLETAADAKVRACLTKGESFAMIAGAGSGKTSSLIEALKFVRQQFGATLRQSGQRVACITYTKRAVAVVEGRLGVDELYHVSTLHSFLWAQIGRFSTDIREALIEHRLPSLIARAREKDTGGASQAARKAREDIARYEAHLEALPAVQRFTYDDSTYSDYANGQLSHDDIIEIAAWFFENKATFRTLLAWRFPYMFIDEAQDTFKPIIEGINLTCQAGGVALAGYFGDPWQQIYDGRAGDFGPPAGGKVIAKEENFRCSKAVIKLLNAFRSDIEQFAAGPNQTTEGSVEIRLVKAEAPAAPRNRYSAEQVERALARMDEAVAAWGWQDRDDVMRLFIVRQMIARRMGFSNLHALFTGPYASKRAQDDYESGEHLLLKPFINTIVPLIDAAQTGDSRAIIDKLRSDSPAFKIDGPNAARPLQEMIGRSKELVSELAGIWGSKSIRDVLQFCKANELIQVSDRLNEQLERKPRAEQYDENLHAQEKGDWLADSFFDMTTEELASFCRYMAENTSYSTQHGVKGEEYPNVMVVFDDVEASWHQYSFTKLLTPRTAGEPTLGQLERGRRIAYVSFSRAEVNLRILLFTPNPEGARAELLDRKLFDESQLVVAA